MTTDAPRRRNSLSQQPPAAYVAGTVLLRGGIVAAGAVGAVVLAAAVLLPLHLWRPVVALPVVAVAVAVVVRCRTAVPVQAVPVPAAAASVALAAGLGVWAALTRSEHVVIRRDAGSYAQYAYWIATRHGLPVDASAQAFGGPAALADPGFRLGSPAFYGVLDGSGTALTADVVPQFMPGPPALWSVGEWVAGWAGLLVAPAVVGALALLAVAGLAARVAGPGWAPLAVLALGVTQPFVHAARSTYSEPVALLLVAAAMSLLVDATATGRDGGDPLQARRIALVAGLAFGLSGLVRVDALRESMLLLPFAAVLALRGHPAARPLVVGTGAGTLVALAWALAFARPYLGSIAGSLVPVAGLAVLLAAGSALAVRWGRRPRLVAATLRRLLPGDRPATLAAAACLAVAVVLASRPLWLVVRQDPQDSGSRFVARLQPGQGLAVDGGRTYAEHSVQWVSWWTGPVAAAAAALVLALAAAAAVRWWLGGSRDVPPLLGPALVAGLSSVLTLYRPGITPDHPWADRRLVVVVLPTVVLAAVAGLSRLVAADRLAAVRARAVPAAVACAGALLLVVPAAVATAPVATLRTEVGEPALVQRVCAELRPGDVVLAVDSRALNEWPQVVRGVCGVPAAAVRMTDDVARPDDLRRVADRAVAAGARPVLLAADPGATFARLGLRAERVVSAVTTEDQRLLVRRPDGVQRLTFDVGLAPWPR